MRLSSGRPVLLAAGACASLIAGSIYPLRAAQSTSSPACRITGRALSAGTPLPGVSIAARAGGAMKAATSTGLDGSYSIVLAPDGAYELHADLPLFAGAQRDVSTGPSPCDAVVDFQLLLAPRGNAQAQPARGVPPPGAASAAGRGDQPARGQPGRFQTLDVQPDAAGGAALDEASPSNDAEVARLLPPGFSVESAGADAVAINGSGDAATLDRGLMSDRLQAIGRGEFDPTTGEFAPGFGPRGGGPGGPGGGISQPGGGGFFPGGGSGGGRGGGAGFGGPGGFVLGGRGARGQNAYQGSINYGFGGSALDAAPYQLRPDAPVTQPQFARNSFGTTVGGPLKIPGIYKDTNRRTSFQLNYGGTRANTVFDQYGTVPTVAMRSGDFASSNVTLIDPGTGQPFADNQIPADRINAASLALLRFVPLPNLPGSSQNFHVSSLSHSTSDSLSLRLNQNLSPGVTAGGRGGAAGGRGGFGRGGGPGGGFGGRGGRGGPGRGTSVMLNVQAQYRRSENDLPNIFSVLDGKTTTTRFSAPVSLNIAHGRSVQNVTVTFTRSSSRASNLFSGQQNVAGDAGILYPSAAWVNPLNWGVPNLSFAGFSGVRSAAAGLRTDRRLTLSYSWTRLFGKHRFRVGADYRSDASSSENNSNARGAYTFTGIYTAAGAEVAGASGADFADFLLGLPQQAALQVGGATRITGRSFDGYIEDNWRRSARLTLNLGLRYDVTMPYTEVDGRLTNLDVTPNFTAAVPVVAGATGPFTGSFPAGLVDADLNNLGPRLGFAYRVKNGTVVRGGYGITYNSGSYAAIARQLSAQPPFAVTETVFGSNVEPLTLQTALLSSTSTTTNNWGVDKNYSLGRIQSWNAAITHDLAKNWGVLLGYTGTKGGSLDILRAPNRDPAGLRIAGVDPFIWESPGGHSLLNAGTFQLRRRLAGGVAGAVTYTLARSMDNASSLGAGRAVVAQNDQDLAAEWALSNFDQRHQVAGESMWELPFGPNRRWLINGGKLAALIGEWNLSGTFTYHSGSPLTARVNSAASDVSRGSAGSLRANYTGAPIALGDPTIGEFFNTAAFSVPAAGTFGNSARNVIVGPSGHQLNAALTRDMRVRRNRTISLSVNATNLLNTVQWASIDADLNSPTFGQVVSVRPMRSVTAGLRIRF